MKQCIKKIPRLLTITNVFIIVVIDIVYGGIEQQIQLLFECKHFPVDLRAVRFETFGEIVFIFLLKKKVKSCVRIFQILKTPELASSPQIALMISSEPSMFLISDLRSQLVTSDEFS